MRKLPPPTALTEEQADAVRVHLIDAGEVHRRLTRRGQIVSVCGAVLCTLALAVAVVAIAETAGRHPAITMRSVVALIVAAGLVLVVSPSRREVLDWRDKRRHGRAEALAHDVAHYLEVDLVPMVATAVEEREIGWAAAPPIRSQSSLDIASVITRLDQLNRELPVTTFGDLEWLWNRVMTCDLPRLRKHVSPAHLAEPEDLNDGYRA